MIGASLELKILIVRDKGVQEETYTKEGNDEQSEVDTFVEVDMFESFLLGEGRTVYFSSILNLFLDIHFSIGILYMQNGEKSLGFG